MLTRWPAALLVVSLVLGCSSPLPLRVRDTQHAGAGDLDTLPAEVHEACDLLGLVCETTSRGYGSITIDLVPTEAPVKGRATEVRCRPWLWADPTPTILAHEIGHALGLEHREDDDALMSASVRGIDLTDDELDAIERGAERLLRCR